VRRHTLSFPSPRAFGATLSRKRERGKQALSAHAILDHPDLNSIAFGGLLFLLSSGFSLAFGLMRIPNLAHGGFFMLGAYLGATITFQGGNFWIAVLGAGLGVGLIGILFERLILRRPRRQCAGPGAGDARLLVHHCRPLPDDLDRRSLDRAGAGELRPPLRLAGFAFPTSASWCSHRVGDRRCALMC